MASVINREDIREFNGQFIGYIETFDNGDKAAYDFPSRRCVGFYRKAQDHTTDFYGVVVARGDAVVSLIYKNKRG